MTRAVLFSMTEAEQRLVAETEREVIRDLDEDELLELHVRVRRARNKYVKLYRRRASDRVGEEGGRGKAHPVNQRDRDKAEVFELALARVSRQVATVAKRAADELRQERLEAARQGSAGPVKPPVAERAAAGSGRRAPFEKTTGGAKLDASTRSQGARRQAKRDSR